MGLLGGTGPSAADVVRDRLAPDAPYPPPRPAQRVALFPPEVGPRLLEAAGHAVYRASRDSRMARPERAPWVQGLLVLLLLAAPVAGTLMLVARLAPWSTPGTRRWLRAAGYVLPVGAVAGFLVYEAGISDIDVDLFLVWPALVVTLVVALAGLVVDLALAARRLRRGAVLARRSD